MQLCKVLTFFVTSVRGKDLAPQIADRASLRLFLAKMPLPAFFMASAFFLPVADCAVLPRRRFSAFVFFNSAWQDTQFEKVNSQETRCAALQTTACPDLI